MLTDSERRAVQEAVALFNAGEYFEAHEVLEEPWRDAAEPAKTFLKGLIHAAVSLYHFERHNVHGGRVKAASCCRYLEPYLPTWGGLDLEGLVRELRWWSVCWDHPGMGPQGPAPSIRAATSPVREEE